MKNFFDDFANVCIPPAHLVPSMLLPPFLPPCPACRVPSCLPCPFLACNVPSSLSSSLLCLPCPFPILPYYFLNFIPRHFPTPHLLSLSSMPICLSLFLPAPPCLFVIYPSPFPPFLSTMPHSLPALHSSILAFLSSLSPSHPCACHFTQMQVGHVVGWPKTASHGRQWSFPASIAPGRPPVG